MWKGGQNSDVNVLLCFVTRKRTRKMTFKCSFKIFKTFMIIKIIITLHLVRFFITIKIPFRSLTNHHSQFNKLSTKHGNWVGETLTILFPNIIAYLIQQPKRSNTFFLIHISSVCVVLYLFVCRFYFFFCQVTNLMN